MGKFLDLNLVAVAEPLDDEKILHWFTELREDLGCKIILGGKGQNTFERVKEFLKTAIMCACYQNVTLVKVA